MATKRKGAKTAVNGVRKDTKVSSPDLNGVTAGTVAPALVDFYTILSLVMGGCCSNVWSYEQLLRMNPQIGSALTFSQMLFITLQSLPTFVSFSGTSSIPSLKPRQVPLKQWAIQVVMLTFGSLLNNWAYAYNVPLTLLIVFRSGGLAISMLLGFVVMKRRYSFLQVLSVLFVSAGVVLATLSRPSGGSSTQSLNPGQYATGITMLVLSLTLTGFLGVLQERTYSKYGPCWKEGVFYTHFLSLPIFLFLVSDIKQGLSSLHKSPSTSPTSQASTYLPYLILGGNLLTQLACVSGVNRLSSRVSSVSTNLVLTVRKALSLCFSVWWFGNGWNTQLAVGAGLVFLGSLMFPLVSQDGKQEKKGKKE
ncbi:UAA transporter [Pluteus cervinus]|uniref:UAA transporter n=1 Tax=Pluteus cervinus TaxID=181527 RepID=A0ACD3AXR2_9AGAR|nr:UAA transporter [Pluteus cervinus]